MKTDSELQRDVLDELKWEPSVRATDIGVEAKQGVVTLAGHVGSFVEKWNAERAAERVAGVKALAVEMDVRLPESVTRTDADIALSAKNILDWGSAFPYDTVKVMAEGGWITLTGQVDWQFQKQAAVDSIRYLLGLKGITNQIVIKKVAASSAIKSGVEAALTRSSRPNHQNLSVEVRDGEVTLTGNVHSFSERDAATHSAWNAPGVRDVIDKITVTY